MNFPIFLPLCILISGLRQNNLPLLWLKRRLTSSRSSSNWGRRRPSVDAAPMELDSALCRVSVGGRRLTVAFCTRTRENRRRRMEAKMETAAGRSAGRPTLALTRSLSLCAATERRDERRTQLARSFLLRSLARSQAFGRRRRTARAPQHHQNSARCPRRPSRIHDAGCIEFIPFAGCRRAEREKQRTREAHAPFFVQTPPHTLGDFQPWLRWPAGCGVAIGLGGAKTWWSGLMNSTRPRSLC